MRALILVDLQYDFLPGGALAVPEGDAVLPVANALLGRFDCVVATQDWHPPGHGSFASQHPGKSPGDFIELHGLPQVLWPDHCVMDSHGAELHPSLDLRAIARIFQKGSDPNVDSYSGFFDNGRRHDTGLGPYLRSRGVSDAFILGLATDYCVKWTALDALSLGFETHLIVDGCRGVNLAPLDTDAAIAELRQAGVALTTATALT